MLFPRDHLGSLSSANEYEYWALLIILQIVVTAQLYEIVEDFNDNY